MKRITSLALLSALLACSKKSSDAPWLTEPDLAIHSARFFAVSQGDPHGPTAGQPLTTCNCCHADRSAAPQPAGAQCLYPPAASFKTYTCTGCHDVVDQATGITHDDIAKLATLPDHVGQAAFDPTQPLAFDKACFDCHRDGSGATPPSGAR